ncbi:hypothetical protein ABPG72_018789 [Tetrahymena utriculariae]
MEAQNKFLVDQQLNLINARISAAILENNNYEQNNIQLFLWNGKSLRIDGNSNNQKFISNQSQAYSMANQEVVTDILLINQNKYSIVCQSDGQLFIKKNNLQLQQSQSCITIQQKQNNHFNAYCRLGFFQYENQNDPTQNKYYLLAADYNYKISIYTSPLSIEYFSPNKKEILENDYFFVQYDQINQVFLALCKDLKLQCHKMNEQTHTLEQFYIEFDEADLKNLGINSVKDFVAFDFQYKDEQFLIYVLGKLIGVFSVCINDMDDSQNNAKLTLLFDPFDIKISRQCDKKNISIFSDKRKQNYNQELTVVFDKLITKFYLNEDRLQKIVDLQDLNNPDYQNFKIDNYICLYGSSENISYHIVNYTNCQKIEDAFKSTSCDRIFIYKES